MVQTYYNKHFLLTFLGHAVAHLVEALRYKSEGRGFDSRWGHWLNPSGLIISPAVDSASNRNEYKEYLLGSKGGQCVGLTTLPPSCSECLEILAASNSWSPQGMSRPTQALPFYLNIFILPCRVNPLRPSGYVTHQHLQHYKTLHSAHELYFILLIDLSSKQRLFHCTALTALFLITETQCVYCAVRVESSYIIDVNFRI